MQRIAYVTLTLCAIVLWTGCEDKKKGMQTAPAYSSSATYEEPSSTYYGPDSSSGLTADDSPSGAMADGSTANSAASDGFATPSTHVVAKGESLYSLARLYYNDQSKWKTIYNANSDVLTDPDMVRVGQKLIIP